MRFSKNVVNEKWLLYNFLNTVKSRMLTHVTNLKIGYLGVYLYKTCIKTRGVSICTLQNPLSQTLSYLDLTLAQKGKKNLVNSPFLGICFIFFLIKARLPKVCLLKRTKVWMPPSFIYFFFFSEIPKLILHIPLLIRNINFALLFFKNFLRIYVCMYLKKV